MELVETAQNSAGKSDEQFAKYTDTLEYKVNALKSAWEALRQAFLKSDFLKKAVDLVTNLVDKLSELNLAELAGIGTIGLTLGKSVVKNFVSQLSDSVQKVTKEWGGRKGEKSSAGDNLVAKAEEAGEGFKADVQAAGETSETAATSAGDTLESAALESGNDIRKAGVDFANSVVKAAGQEGNMPYTPNSREPKPETKPASTPTNESTPVEKGKGIKNSLKSSGKSAAIAGVTTGIMAGIATGDITTSLVSALGVAVTSMIPVLVEATGSAIASVAAAIGTATAGITGGVLAAIAVVGVAIYKYRKKQIKQIKEAEEAELKRLKNIKDTNAKLAQEQASAVQDTNKTYSDEKKLQEDIDTYNKYHGNAFLTDENQEKLNNAISDLNDNFSSVVTAYDESTQTLSINTDAVEALKEEYKQQRLENEQKIINAGIQTGENIQFSETTSNRILANLSGLASTMGGYFGTVSAKSNL